MTFITKLSDGRFGTNSSYHGPFNPSGNTKYVPLLNSTLRTIGMAKATLASPGDSDWSQIAADIAISDSSDIACLYAFHDSGNTRIGIATAQTNGAFRYHEFNTSTEAWDITNETIRLVVASPDVYSIAASKPSIAASYRDDGDVVCVHNGEEDGGTGPHGQYRAIRTTVWGLFSKFNNSGQEIGATLSSGGPTSLDKTNFLTQRGVADHRRIHFTTGSTTRNQDTDSIIDSSPFAAGPGTMDGSEVVYFPYIKSDNDVHVVHWDGTDDNSSTTITDVGPIGDQGNVAFNGATTTPFPPMGLVWDGTDVHLIYAAASDGDIYHNDDATGTGGTETKIVSGITCRHLSAGISASTDDILLIYSDGDTVPVFTKVTVGASPPAVNYPLSSFLIGLRKLPSIPDEPPPEDPPLVLPPVEGEVLWEQNWDQCILSLLNPPWTFDTRGSVNLSDPSDQLCGEPGRLRRAGWPSGTLETVFDSTLNANAVQILSSRTQYETLDQDNDKKTTPI